LAHFGDGAARAPAEPEAEVDFGEVLVDLAGARTKLYLFVFRLCYSGKAIHRLYPTLSQEAFLEGHVAAFEELGGIPTLQIKYDNLGQAVKKVLGPSRRREENDRWVLFRSHYGFDAFYCEPGIDGAHEKGATCNRYGSTGVTSTEAATPEPLATTITAARIVMRNELLNMGYPSNAESKQGLPIHNGLPHSEHIRDEIEPSRPDRLAPMT
jgi:transposase